MLRRDRNHPSIFLWSIGNEIEERYLPQGIEIGKKLRNVCKKYDQPRPVTTAINGWGDGESFRIYDITDIAGYNYGELYYDDHHKKHPERCMMGTEVRAVVSYEKTGYYENFLAAGAKYEQEIKDGEKISVDEYLSREEFWRTVTSRDYMQGCFIWTGWDYKGEAHGLWPVKSAHYAPVDLAGFVKAEYYLYKSIWGDEPTVHLLPHWNLDHKEGELVPVGCYTNCDEVELFVCGKSYGRKKIHDDIRHLYWMVEYKKGEVIATGYNAGKEVCTYEMVTSGEAHGIQLSVDHERLSADVYDLAYIEVSIVDKDGNIVPTADNEITFSVAGAGALAGVDNGDYAHEYIPTGNIIAALSGHALAVVKSINQVGDVTVEATSKDLESCEIVISCE